MGIDPYKLQEAKTIDQRLGELLDATNEAAALTALRKLFVGELDFNSENRSIPLHRDQPPMSASYIASLDGVRVVAVRLSGRGRVLMRDVQDVLKRAREQVGGDILLAAGAEDGSEWQLVYPSMRGEKEVLRRITLHRGQHHRTVAEQLAAVYAQVRKTGIADALDRAYDVEAVTKNFFREYKRIFQYAMEQVNGFPDENERRLFCQTLFNRLMFIYFLQRKGWLRFGDSADYLYALWNDAQGGAENFYDVRLRLLFFAGLNNERTADFDQARRIAEPLIGEVPFLNGGLFAESELDQRPGIHVPDSVIEALLEDLFHKFNFTISESTPYDVQVAVDPEMLGKVFEELVTGRHESGSYYTPRPIVSFMCREALKGYLKTRVPDLSDDAVSRYVDEHDVSAINREAAGRILGALETITVVDPACGSGAYLLGMMQELLELENLLYNPSLIAKAEDTYRSKLRIIEKNVYGVDIDQFAVNTAMLRLWLSLIVDYEGQGDPPPLPNLDFKIACGDSLWGPDPQEIISDMFRTKCNEMASELAALKAEYMLASGGEKDDLHRQIEAQMMSLQRMMVHTDVPKTAVDWRVAFADVFERGGFDVVVANPPYVRQELIKAQKPQLRDVYGALFSGTADLYVYFYYRALQLLCDGGMLVFISSNKWFRAAYGSKLRELLATRAAIYSITDFRDLPVFESATAYPMIFIAQRAGSPRAAHFTEVPSLRPPYPDVHALTRRHGFDLPHGAIDGAEWRLTGMETIKRLKLMRVGTTPLGKYVGDRIFYGVKTGFNKAFVIDPATRDALIAADPNSAEIIKPFIVGRDIRRWTINHHDRYLITTKIGTDIRRYSAVFEHLQQWQPQLEMRWDKGEHWWELRACAYYDAFEAPKIVYQEIATYQSFAFDASGSYANNKVFIIPTDELFLLAVLNSQAAWLLLDQICSKLNGGAFALQSIYLSQLPIPEASSAERTTIERLVQACLEARGKEFEVAEWEAEMNARVARLYGLEEDQALPGYLRQRR
jgi:TaqI-like C-terminal specificity domain/Eco57I restriction-modification methylase